MNGFGRLPGSEEWKRTKIRFRQLPGSEERKRTKIRFGQLSSSEEWKRTKIRSGGLQKNGKTKIHKFGWASQERKTQRFVRFGWASEERKTQRISIDSFGFGTWICRYGLDFLFGALDFSFVGQLDGYFDI
ncbi:unnamed protein product [Rhizophagus irregularis]|nr:unnamed protein product [Rhizophagus irregularis]